MPKDWITDHKWHDIRFPDLPDWVKWRSKDLNRQHLLGRSFEYRRDPLTGQYQRKLRRHPPAWLLRLRRGRWSSFRGGAVKVLVSLAIIAGLGALAKYGYLLFKHEVKPLPGSIMFLSGIVAWVLLIRFLRRRYGRMKPSFKFTTFSLIAILLVFAFSGVQPLAQYKDRLIADYQAAQSRRAAEAEMEETLPLSESPAYLEAIELCPQLGSELRKLPQITDGLSPEDLEALDDICALYVDNPQTRQAFSLMMEESIEQASAYCTPLEALLWIAYDEELSQQDFWEDYSLEELLDHAWRETTASDCYQSEHWQDFDEVTRRLNSPTLLMVYMRDNFSYDWDKYKRWISGDHRWDMPRDTFRKKKSDCGGQAIFGLHCLLRNGYQYDDFEQHTDNCACLLGCWNPEIPGYRDVHTVLLYKQDNAFFTLDSGRTTNTGGPFGTVEMAATASLPSWGIYYFYNTEPSITETGQRDTSSKGPATEHENDAQVLLGLERETLALINEERAEQGLAPVMWNEELHSSARRHSEDMQERGERFRQ